MSLLTLAGLGAVILAVAIATMYGLRWRYRWLIGAAGLAAVLFVALRPVDDAVRTFWSYGEGGYIYALTFSPDGRTLLAGSSSGVVVLFDAASGQVVRRFGGDTALNINAVAFSPDGRSAIAAGASLRVHLYDVATGQPRLTFNDPVMPINRFEPGDRISDNAGTRTVAFSPDGRAALSAGWSNVVKLWSLESGDLIRTLQGHTGAVSSAAFSPDGGTILSASSFDRSVRLWDVASGKELRSIQAYGVNAVAFLPDGRAALTGGNEIVLWDLESGAQIRDFPFSGGRLPTTASVAVSRDGRTALSGGRNLSSYPDILQLLFPSLGDSSDRKVRLWDIATGKLLRAFEGHTGRIHAVTLSPDGRLAASAADEIKVWELAPRASN